MRNKFLMVFAALLLSFYILHSTFYIPTYAQSPENQPTYKEEFKRATVVEILEEGEKDQGEVKTPYQKVKLKDLETGEDLEIEHGSRIMLTDSQRVKVGDSVVIFRTTTVLGQDQYQIIDKYRLNDILKILLIFFVLIITVARFKGLGSIIGLAISLLVIVYFLVPQIVAGRDPVLISITGSFVIMLTTIYLAHGISTKTSVAVLSTFITLIITGILSYVFVSIAKLSGLGSEEAYGLTLNANTNFNYAGLLLGGMIIGALGVLDDITTTQSAAIFELKHASPRLDFAALFKRGLNIGKEHVSSLVNTLVLAYSGTSLPLFIIIALNPTDRPLWFLLNMEAISEEVIRTLAGSMGLTLAVPITTLIAAWVATKKVQITP